MMIGDRLNDWYISQEYSERNRNQEIWNISRFCPTDWEGQRVRNRSLISKKCPKSGFANFAVSHCDRDNLSLSENSPRCGGPRKSVQQIFLFLRDAINILQ